jgi:hypothetical protein
MGAAPAGGTPHVVACIRRDEIGNAAANPG